MPDQVDLSALPSSGAMLHWHEPMTSSGAAHYLMTKGFVAAELYDAEVLRLEARVKLYERSALSEQNRAVAAESRVAELEAMVRAASGVDENETTVCSRCEGRGALYADGKAHYHSEHAPTMPCPACGGEGRLVDADGKLLRIAQRRIVELEAEVARMKGFERARWEKVPAMFKMRLCAKCGGIHQCDSDCPPPTILRGPEVR